MVYLDVTGACKSPKNTGMQRITRHIFLHLSEVTPTTPICWNLTGNRYHLLGRRERNILKRPFQVFDRPSARPEMRGEHFFAEVHRHFFRKGIALRKTLERGDALLIPDIYRDGRLIKLPRLLAQTEARTVAIFHDAAALRLPHLYPGTHLKFQAYIKSLADFDLVICVSQESRDELLRLWSEFNTVPTETSVETWPVELDRDRASDRASDAANLIVCVGSFEPRKNHIGLLRAADNLWETGLSFRLELIGRSTGYFGHEVIGELRRLRRKGRDICWSKHVNDEHLYHAYRECRFTVYPSLMEGFGLPIAESLLHGKPCICGGNGALGEIARGGGCLIIDQQSEDSLAAGIKKLLTDQQTYTRLANEAGARSFRDWPEYIDTLTAHLHTSAPAPSAAVAASL